MSETTTRDGAPPEAGDVAPATGSVHERMLAILTELPAIGKTSKNTQQNFMYRSHDDVLNALNPLLAKHGVFVVPTVLERVSGERSTSRGSTMYEVNLHVAFAFYGAEGDVITASAWGEGTDMGDKSTNKAMTMAFKNVLAQAFAVSTSETVDTDSASPEETSRGGGGGGQRPADVQTADEERVEHLRALAHLCDIKPNEIEGKLDAARAANYGELHPDYVENQIAGLEKKVSERAKRARTAIEGLVGDLEGGGLMSPGGGHWHDFFFARTPIADLTLEQARAVVPILRKPGTDSDTLAAALESVIGPVPEVEPI